MCCIEANPLGGAALKSLAWCHPHGLRPGPRPSPPSTLAFTVRLFIERALIEGGTNFSLRI